ncbi:MAG: 3' terminal RNA ribose 2'-O-methyltransferase Hen1 [Defluviitaleaceae bacterium]|nr:3' terminal RNA ribose 2'-O-methyltransferase Hen1 [Defluviitaleaceae bacterium]
MILTISYTGENTTDLGYLLYKNPYRPQAFDLNHGKAYVFYPEISNQRTTAALLLDINPIDLARGKVGSQGGGLFEYVNDRPYVSSSFMSTAISKVFGTAMTGRADAHQELSDTALELTATIATLPCRGERGMLNKVFEPLGYAVEFEQLESGYVNLTISGKIRLRDLLKHLYVLIPVFDKQKHYWVGEDEVEKLLRLGEDWLPNHPERNYITGRYLKRRNLVNLAFAKLAEDTQEESEPPSEITPKRENLNTQRLSRIVDELKEQGVNCVIDLGCGEGKLLNLLLKNRQFTHIAGMDVSHAVLERANARLKLEYAGDSVRDRVQLFQGSLSYKDDRFTGYDAACVIEVIEHMDISRLTAFEWVLFEFTKPPVVILTTPNKEYNEIYNLTKESLRHDDHRFEWTREQFREWATTTAEKHNYTVKISEIGEVHEIHGAPTQMGVFTLCE